MVHSGAESASNFNPGVLRNRFVNGGWIASSGSLSDEAVSKANSPYFYYIGERNYANTSFSGIVSDIKSLLSQGYYIEASVENNGHRVAVNYATNNEVYIMDPGHDRTTLSYYNGTIHHVNYYKAEKRYSATPVEDTLTLTNYNAPSMLALGQSFSIKGTVTSAVSNITSLTVGVYDYNGNFKTGKTVYPNTTSYNLVNIDPYVKFGSLAKGTYYYCVYATNKSISAYFLGDTFTVS